MADTQVTLIGLILAKLAYLMKLNIDFKILAIRVFSIGK